MGKTPFRVFLDSCPRPYIKEEKMTEENKMPDDGRIRVVIDYALPPLTEVRLYQNGNLHTAQSTGRMAEEFLFPLLTSTIQSRLDAAEKMAAALEEIEENMWRVSVHGEMSNHAALSLKDLAQKMKEALANWQAVTKGGET